MQKSFMVETKKKPKLSDIFTDFAKMPETMRQLSWVQFFSWFGLFGMWVFTTPAIAQHIYGLVLMIQKVQNFKMLVIGLELSLEFTT
jgi:maltose/moltooligosaccharide transporter